MSSNKNALVIGVSDYQNISPLSNTVNDAEDMAKALRKLGFTVMLETNPTLTEFEDALENFASSIQYNKDVALFYYSGHGIQVDGKNYLIPKNAELDREIRIKKQTIDLEEVIQSVSAARNELNIFILDACRDNPFAGKFKSVNRGLAEIKKMPPSTYFAYAAAAGQTASDGNEDSRNGIFTESFLKVLEEYSSEEIDMIFRKTRSSVLKKTKNVQEPWTNHNLSERYYLIESTVETHLMMRPKEASLSSNASSQEQRIPSTPIVEMPIPTVGIGRDRSEISNDQPVDNTKKWGIIAVAAIVLSVISWFGYSRIDLKSEKMPNEFKNSIGMEFVLIPSGEFMMGCSEGDGNCLDNEKPVHKVKITKSFYMGKYEVTKEEFQKFVNEKNYKTEAEKGEGCAIFTGTEFKYITGTNWKKVGFMQTDKEPVVCISWNDAKAFIEWLSQKESKRYTLPTEAEWEYAARGLTKRTTQTTTYYANDLSSIAWYSENSALRTHPVGQKTSNAFGLYDMSGNVWEWTEDWYGEESYSSSEAIDPTGASIGTNRVIRGCSWINNAQNCRSSFRGYGTPDGRLGNMGFRVVLLP